MTELRLILGDQLNPHHGWFYDCNPNVIYVMLELRAETAYVLHHAQKVIAIFAAMRAFASSLKEKGHRVRYVRLSDSSNRGALEDNLNAQKLANGVLLPGNASSARHTVDVRRRAGRGKMEF
ncbi:cryptochrome/photolyase family protein [Enterobacter mori]|uniref:cryptochrome/photolyase family protein n=1 Tax=Enterobacter mori TaxID=539813 RepID=UPI002A7EDE0B|nr:cryptochrome/photolyase family protein [Enterobacter mori]